MSPRLRPLAWLALALLALHVTVALPGALRRAAAWTWAAVERAGEEPGAVERRMTGEAYFDGVARLRRILPRDAPYGLVTAGPEVEGVGNWVRFDLAPRRAVFLGSLRSLPGPARMARRIPPDLGYVVVAGRPGEAPLVFEREGFLRWLRERRGAERP
jgi:hypothetical protein